MGLDMYAEDLIANYEHPHNKRRLSHSDSESHEYNPICGDDITVYIKVNDGKIGDISFEGNGCAISVGTASKLTDLVKGKSLSEIERMGFEDIVNLIGIDPGPARAKCASISLKALKHAVFVYEHKNSDAVTDKL
ncbi:iron-sulfur cluster assembly scaffold protein [Candidatus Marsarchaeota archaeon]|nr:iron-sulfur cluster assembly scaffold protein [Candidatus Marsarchaeota archaeon]MCL5404914.1 iron-sulfur cluster assembly scaffold protein [Candidatus Marsarchaeota archaeon]